MSCLPLYYLFLLVTWVGHVGAWRDPSATANSTYAALDADSPVMRANTSFVEVLEQQGLENQQQQQQGSSLRQRRLRQIQRHLRDASPPASSSFIELLPESNGSAQLSRLLGLIDTAHDDRASLKEALAKAVYLVHPGQPADKLDCAWRARQLESLADQRKLFLQSRAADLSEVLGMGDAPVQLEVDDEDGQPRRKVPAWYHTLPLYGRLPTLQPKPEVLVTVSLFQNDRSSGGRYREGVLQMVESLPHISQRMGIRLAIFHDRTVPEDFLKTLVDRPRVTLVSVDELDGSNHSSSLAQVQTGSLFHTASARFRWHDLAALRSEGMARLGMTDLPDAIMTYDTDSLLDSPFLDWWVRQITQGSREEYIYIIEGTLSPGPNGLPRAIDASTFAVAPKRMPPNFVWPGSVAGEDFPQVAGKSLVETTAGPQPPTTGIKSFIDNYSRSRRDGYGIDEEGLCSLIEAVIARDGSTGIRASNSNTLDMVTVSTMNTGEVDETSGQSTCDDTNPASLTYGAWTASEAALQQHEDQAAQGHYYTPIRAQHF